MLQLVTPSKIIDLSSSPDVGVTVIRCDLDNMARALARHHGEETARDLVAEAFARAFARWAQDSGRAIAARFALEVTLDNAFKVEAARRAPAPFVGPAA